MCTPWRAGVADSCMCVYSSYNLGVVFVMCPMLIVFRCLIHGRSSVYDCIFVISSKLNVYPLFFDTEILLLVYVPPCCMLVPHILLPL